mmetsp:Transcript_54027/g.80611  ORF Transcript_54027/g.80611 Transcript_54027/m.80611 type:complete len:206 (+) Transcript_54027:552-1169(+)
MLSTASFNSAVSCLSFCSFSAFFRAALSSLDKSDGSNVLRYSTESATVATPSTITARRTIVDFSFSNSSRMVFLDETFRRLAASSISSRFRPSTALAALALTSFETPSCLKTFLYCNRRRRSPSIFCIRFFCFEFKYATSSSERSLSGFPKMRATSCFCSKRRCLLRAFLRAIRSSCLDTNVFSSSVHSLLGLLLMSRIRCICDE